MNAAWIPLAIVLPLLAALGLAAAGKYVGRTPVDLAAITASTLTAVVCAALTWHVIQSGRPLVYWMGDWLPRGRQVVGIGLVVDTLGAATATYCGFLMTAALVFSWHYLDAPRALYHVLMLVFLAAMVGFCLTADLFNLFVFFELMSVSAYALTGYKIEEQSSLEGSINFAVVNTIGAYLLLIGVGMFYARTGALNLAQIGEELAPRPVDGLVVVASALVFAGFFIKAAIVPFHFWLSDAHAVAPTPVCVLFSGIMVELGLFGAARVYWVGLSGAAGPYAERIRVVLIAAGIFTALMAAAVGYVQRHIKRLLAFSTISHAGMMLMGIGLLSAQGLAATLIYIAGHGLIKGALFMLTGIMLNRLGSIDQFELTGKGRSEPWLGTAFLIGALALVGLPPFGTWLGKAALNQAAADAGMPWLKWVWMLAAIMTGGTVLGVFGRVFLGWGAAKTDHVGSPTEREPAEARERRRRLSSTLIIAIVLLILAGAMGCTKGLLTAIAQPAGNWCQRAHYAAIVYGQAPPPAAAVSTADLSWQSVAIGLGEVVAAMLAARFSLSVLGQRIGKHRSLRKVGRILNAIHSGYLGDYILWLMVGLVLLGTSLAVAMR